LRGAPGLNKAPRLRQRSYDRISVDHLAGVELDAWQGDSAEGGVICVSVSRALRARTRAAGSLRERTFARLRLAFSS